MRVVVDTNVLVSYFLRRDSVPGQAARKAIATARIVFSDATLAELIAVLERKHLSRFSTPELRKAFVRSIVDHAEIVEIIRPLRICRDPGDDKFLDVAAHCNASYLITGDKDLLVLHPFLDTAIVPPADFLAL